MEVWVYGVSYLLFFFFQAEDGIRGRDGWLEFRRVLFRSASNLPFTLQELCELQLVWELRERSCRRKLTPWQNTSVHKVEETNCHWYNSTLIRSNANTASTDNRSNASTASPWTGKLDDNNYKIGHQAKALLSWLLLVIIPKDIHNFFGAVNTYFTFMMLRVHKVAHVSHVVHHDQPKDSYVKRRQ